MPSETLELQRQFSTAPERLFEVFTSPELLQKWHCGTVAEAIMELWPGGRFLIRFSPDENFSEEQAVRGTYREVSAPSRLVYTWKWDGSDEESLVTVLFEPSAGGTLLKIRHEALSEESAFGHRLGWEACLEGIEQTQLSAQL